MEERKELTDEQRDAIIYDYKSHETLHAIANRVGCSKMVVDDTIKRFWETDCTKSQVIQTGHPCLIKAPLRILLKQLIKDDRRLNTFQITNIFNAYTNLNASKITVHRALYKENMKCWIAHPKSLLSEVNIAARLTWCLKWKDWSARQFHRVLWSDETSVFLFRQGSCCQVWHEPQEVWKLECLSSTVKRSASRMF